MKDIDFDELDKAVSSVLGSKSDEAPASSTSPESSSPAAPSVAASPVDEPAARSASVASESQRSASPLAVKRRGQFMDVVHPSSDMNKTSESSRPLLSPSTQKRLEPTSEAVQAPEPAVTLPEPDLVIPDKPTEEVEEPAPFTPPAEPVVEEPPKLESPVELTSPVDTAEPATPTDEPSTETPAESSMTMPDSLADFNPDKPATPEPDAPPVTTPFLSDAKVEKRPLGGFGDEQPAEATPEPAQPGATNTPNLSQPPAVTLPRELQSDIVQVEATHEGAPGSHEAPAKNDSLAGKLSLDDSHETAHPLFDTTNYHEPIAAAPKKKGSSWIWILIGLLVCLTIGAGVGYFIYTAGL